MRKNMTNYGRVRLSNGLRILKLGLDVKFILSLLCSGKQVYPSVCHCISASTYISITYYDKHLEKGLGLSDVVLRLHLDRKKVLS